MARKLQLGEEAFEQMHPASGPERVKAFFAQQAMWLGVSDKRDKALDLSPQLGEWFGKEFPLRTEN